MIEYFTVMIITYWAAGEELQSKIAFPSHQACSAAMETFHDRIDGHFPGAMTQCEQTDIISRSIRPKARPPELEGLQGT